MNLPTDARGPGRVRGQARRARLNALRRPWNPVQRVCLGLVLGIGVLVATAVGLDLAQPDADPVTVTVVGEGSHREYVTVPAANSVWDTVRHVEVRLPDGGRGLVTSDDLQVGDTVTVWKMRDQTGPDEYGRPPYLEDYSRWSLAEATWWVVVVGLAVMLVCLMVAIEWPDGARRRESDGHRPVGNPRYPLRRGGTTDADLPAYCFGAFLAHLRAIAPGLAAGDLREWDAVTLPSMGRSPGVVFTHRQTGRTFLYYDYFLTNDGGWRRAESPGAEYRSGGYKDPVRCEELADAGPQSLERARSVMYQCYMHLSH